MSEENTNYISRVLLPGEGQSEIPIKIPIEQVFDLEGTITGITNRLSALEYFPIEITSFSHGKSTQERGKTITSVTLSWGSNKSPQKVFLNGEELANTVTSKTLSGLDITWSNVPTWTLKLTDLNPGTNEVLEVTKSIKINFANNVYYGVSVIPDAINSNFVNDLDNQVLSDATGRTVSYNAGEGEYLWYCSPVRLGARTFTDTETGLGAGFSQIGDPIGVTNASGYLENYYIYRSDYAGLGSVTVKVS